MSNQIDKIRTRTLKIKVSQKSQHTEIKNIIMDILDILEQTKNTVAGLEIELESMIEIEEKPEPKLKQIPEPEPISNNMKKANEIMEKYQKQQQEKEN